MIIDRERQAHVATCHARIQETTRRLDELRSRAERQRGGRRQDVERTLDRLRGLRNRALARLEDCRRAGGDAWPSIRNQATTAVDELVDGLAEVEAMLERVAA